MPAAARVDDPDVVHCSRPYRAQGSPNVYVNGKRWSRQGDLNTTHDVPGDPCPSHTAPITSGSSTVKVNGKGAGRVGDSITDCTSVAAGSFNVFAGG